MCRFAPFLPLLVAVVSFHAPNPCAAQSLNFVDETATRLSTIAGIPASDSEEKDFAVGDFDRDGDDDVVMVRKLPFTRWGPMANVLLMNESGLLTDMTTAKAPDLALITNDRDVAVADFDGDDWPDLVTAISLGDGQIKSQRMPRLYRNKGGVPGMSWDGFEYVDSWFPDMAVSTGQPTSGPRFCTVAVLDADDDGDMDLYFGDHDRPAFPTPGFQLFDYNDRLFLNVADTAPPMTPIFVDATSSHILNSFDPVHGGPQSFYLSGFTASAVGADINGDGLDDIVRQDEFPQLAVVGYQDLVTYMGTPNTNKISHYDEVYTGTAYHVAVGDLNNDGRNDIVVVDDGIDKVLFNAGTDGNSQAIFGAPVNLGPVSEFGGNAYVRDLNRDGWPEVIVCDMDVDVPGCARRLRVFENSGDGSLLAPGTNSAVTLTDVGAHTWTPNGTYDVAILDINGDEWPDIVAGTCTGTKVYINTPLPGLDFMYPGDILEYLEPGTTESFSLVMEATGGDLVGPVKLHYRQGGDPFQEIDLSGPVPVRPYEYTFPLSPTSCEELEYYFSATHSVLGQQFDPPGGASAPYQKTVGAVASFTPNTSLGGWTVTDSPGLASGTWTQVNNSVPTLLPPLADPLIVPQHTTHLVTGEAAMAGDLAESADVDSGSTRAESPAEPLDGGHEMHIEFEYIFRCLTADLQIGSDTMSVSVSGNGGASWVHVVDLGDTGPDPKTFSFLAGDYAALTGDVKLAIEVESLANPADSVVTDALIEHVLWTVLDCPPAFIRGDANSDLFVDVSDGIFIFEKLIGSTGPFDCDDAADVNDDGTLNLVDGLFVLNVVFGLDTLPSLGTCGPDPTEPDLDCANPTCP